MGYLFECSHQEMGWYPEHNRLRKGCLIDNIHPKRDCPLQKEKRLQKEKIEVSTSCINKDTTLY